MAQAVHAAGYSSPGNLPHSTYAVALSCADEAELTELYRRLKMAGLNPVPIREPDEPYNGELMAIGMPPAYKSAYRRFLSNLPLVK